MWLLGVKELRRPAISIFIGFGILVLAGLVFAGATWGWPWRHQDKSDSMGAMALYANDPTARFEVHLDLKPEKNSDRLAGDLTVRIVSRSNPARLRWALVGLGRLRFSADMSDGRSSETRRVIPEPNDPSMRWCGEDGQPPKHSILSGNGAGAGLMGTSGVARFVSGSLGVHVHFDNIRKSSDVDSYEWRIGAIGLPLGDCIRLNGVGNLTATRLPFEVQLQPVHQTDRILDSDPVTSGGHLAVWPRMQGQYVEAAFEDAKAKKYNAAFASLAGVLAGIGATFIAAPLQQWVT